MPQLANFFVKTRNNLLSSTTNQLQKFFQRTSAAVAYEDKQNIKFSNGKIINAYFTHNEDTLRQKGFTPENLYNSSEASFAYGQKIRGRMQCNTMLRFTPQENEAPVYEKSGNLLSTMLNASLAVKHWDKAYEFNHRPYEMTEKLGHQFLLKGNLPKAQAIFEDQTKTFPDNPVPFNELGVTQFIQATRQNKLDLFAQHRRDAMNSFSKSKELDPNNKTADMNFKVANLLNMSPIYGHPERYLDPRIKLSTPMIEAIYKDLRLNSTSSETTMSPGVGVGLPMGGSSAPSIQTIAISNTKTIHHSANEIALYELGKLMNEESVAETSVNLKR